MAESSLSLQEKQEVKAGAEGTRDVPLFVPLVDIFETEKELTVVADMPGVGPNGIDIDLHDSVLTIRGTAENPGKSERTLLAEYAVGDYHRRFTLSRVIDQGKITASMKDGVLTLVLPKVEAAQPRKIAVKSE